MHGAATVRVRLRDAGGAEVASAEGASGALRVPRPGALGTGPWLPLRPRGRVGRRRRRRRQVHAPGRHPHRTGRGHALPHQRRALLLPGLRQARGPRRPRPRSRRCRHGARLLAALVDRGQLVPHLPLPLCRGGAGPSRPRGHRRDRRDGRGRAQPRRGWRPLPRRPEDDLFGGDDQRRHAARAPPGDRGAHCAGQEPSVRRPLEPGQRARVAHRGRRAPTSSPCSTSRGTPTRADRWDSST